VLNIISCDLVITKHRLELTGELKWDIKNIKILNKKKKNYNKGTVKNFMLIIQFNIVTANF
jgi:hypothetical protein